MGILDTWNQYREAKKNQRQKESDLIDLIERMVQDCDPSIRKAAGYRQQLQTAQQGEIVRRDVPQVAVEFYDHRVVAPVATEAEIRRELVHRGLNLLATNTLEEILRIQSIREELTEERRLLAVKLKIQHSRERGLERLLAGGSKNDADQKEARQLLEEIDKQLMELEPGSGTPRAFLQKLEEVLLDSAIILTGKTIGMRLNWMGVKLNEESTENGREIILAELEIPNRLKRIAILANISVNECLRS